VPYPDQDTPLLLLLVLADRHMAAALQAQLVAAGFVDHRLAHHTVMAHVTFAGIRLTELAERAGVTKQAMSELVHDLTDLGYLRTKPDPTDGRAKLITFTKKGERAVKAAMDAFDGMDRSLAKNLGAGKLAELRRGLLHVIDTPL
jgi:DNA-binding MarR family transcriptional regulator